MSKDLNAENRIPFKADTEEGYDFYLSLSKIYGGRAIKDVMVYVSEEFGEPSLGVSRIVFDDDSFLGVDGEHDIAYIEEHYKASPECVVDLETLVERYEDDEDEAED